ncbi:MAG: Gp49 family protein [Pseudomonadota bacterium]
MSGSLEVADAEAAAVQKTPNRATLEYIKSRIKDVEYINPAGNPIMTIAVIYYENGFVLTGHSAPADAGNFNAELGKKVAYEDALWGAWPLEEFALRERLYREEEEEEK